MRWVFYLIAVVCLLSGLQISCHCDDDDDNDNDTGGGDDDDDDNDTAVDDDAADDDDDTGDDDDDDDNDTGDDDDDDDMGDDDTVDDDTASEPYPLLFLGNRDLNDKDDSGLFTSWRQVEGGWEERPVPAWPRVVPELGPAFFRNGRRGYAILNDQWLIWRVYPVRILMASCGYAWLSYDEESGWRFDDELEAASKFHNMDDVFAPSRRTLWTTGERFVAWGDYYAPSTIEKVNVFRHVDGMPTPTLDGTFDSMWFVSADEGMAFTNTNRLTWDGVGWTYHDLPEGFEDMRFTALYLRDMQNGFALGWDSPNTYRVLALENGVWSAVAFPTGCEELEPNHMAFTGRFGVVTSDAHGSTNPNVMLYDDGTWSCRALEVGGASYHTYNVVQMRDGRRFIYLVSYAPEYKRKIGEITASGQLVVFDAPPDMEVCCPRMFGLGPGAPQYAVQNEW